MASPEPTIHGTVSPGFEPVRHTLRQNFRLRGEWGCSVSVWHEGQQVVDLWAGTRDRAQGLPFEADTLCTAFSSTKGIVALAFLMLADRGLLDYDTRIADLWPGFGCEGKQAITVRMLLNHRSGLVEIKPAISIRDIQADRERVSGILERTRPLWEPDTLQGYHAITYGLFASELFLRITGETLGSFISREIAEPLGADVFLGLPEALESRVAVNHPATSAERAFRIIPKALIGRGREGRVFREVLVGGTAARAFANPKELGPSGVHNFNTRVVHSLELAWCNALVSARGLGRVYAALAEGGSLGGVKLVSPESIEPLKQRQSWVERDEVLRKPLGYTVGFLKEESGIFSPNQTSFGHPGAGGALGWCDPENRLSIGYVTCKMAHHIRSPRAQALSHVIYRCLR